MDRKPNTRRLARDEDRFGESRSMGISTLRFNVATEDCGGRLFLIEQTMHAQCSPPRHVHFSPAGQMEAFFQEVTKTNAMPPEDPALWRAHGMEVVGPPLLTDRRHRASP